MRPFRESLSADPIRWALVADDLTGAADSAVAFALAGFKTVLALGEDAVAAQTGELLAVSTDTRDERPREASRRVTQTCCGLLDAKRRVVFHKVDSLLRGNVREETEAALEACGFATAVLCPALPREGRAVENGRLETGRDDGGRLLPRSSRLVTPDASTERDLERLAASLLDLDPPALPAGSSGLAFAWARALAQLHGRTPVQASPPPTDLPLAFVIGSIHERTVAQMERLAAGGGASLAALEDLPGRRWDERDLIVRIPIVGADPADLEPLADRLAEGACGGLVMSGGATAGWTLDALGAHSIEIDGEALAGCPWGTARGGAADGVTVTTKSGAFGNADALVRIAALLHGRQ